jgi:hypothetical protein
MALKRSFVIDGGFKKPSIKFLLPNFILHNICIFYCILAIGIEVMDV